MKNRIFCLATLLFLAVSTFGQTASLSLSKSFNAEGIHLLNIQLPGEVSLVVWDKPHINVAISAEVGNATQNIADELARVGRYDLKGQTDGGILLITAPNQKKTVSIRGKELSEKMDYTLYIPAQLKVEISGKTTEVMAGSDK